MEGEALKNVDMVHIGLDIVLVTWILNCIRHKVQHFFWAILRQFIPTQWDWTLPSTTKCSSRCMWHKHVFTKRAENSSQTSHINKGQTIVSHKSLLILDNRLRQPWFPLRDRKSMQRTLCEWRQPIHISLSDSRRTRPFLRWWAKAKEIGLVGVNLFFFSESEAC